MTEDMLAVIGFIFVCGLSIWAVGGICKWGYDVHVGLKYVKDALDRVDGKLDRIIGMLQEIKAKLMDEEEDDAD